MSILNTHRKYPEIKIKNPHLSELLSMLRIDGDIKSKHVNTPGILTL